MQPRSCDNFRPVASHVELEIKLRVQGPGEPPDRLERVNARLEEMGATLLHPREFEDNLAFDFPDRSVVRRGSLLRVRTLDRQTLLTWKGPVQPAAQPDPAGGRRDDPGNRMKSREEIEVTLAAADSGSLIAILRGLGMEPVFQYQKYRTTWDWKGLHILVDETPIGIYLELEGDRVSIEAGAEALGYRSEDFITKSYRDLYLEHLDRGGDAADRGGEGIDRGAQGLQGSHSSNRMVFRS